MDVLVLDEVRVRVELLVLEGLRVDFLVLEGVRMGLFVLEGVRGELLVLGGGEVRVELLVLGVCGWNSLSWRG